MIFFIKKYIYNNFEKFNKINLSRTGLFIGKRHKLYNLYSYVLNLSIYGIGIKRFLLYFIHSYGFGRNIRFYRVPVSILQEIQNSIRFLLLNLDLKNFIKRNIFFKRRIQVYQGIRSMLNLPQRGQRSKTNAGTNKRKRKGQFSMKKHK